MRPSVCLVGYNTATGIGELNRQLVKHVSISHWLIKPHTVFESQQPPENIPCTSCVGRVAGKAEEDVIKASDIVLFVEVPYYNNLLDLCVKHGKRTICIPMMEWLPPRLDGWPKNVNLFVCPTRQCYDTLNSKLPCVYFPWPVDVSRFSYRKRELCKQFVFINGHGGWRNRKGAPVIQAVLSKWPNMPLLIYDQGSSTKWANATIPAVAQNYMLYGNGDVLVSPHSVDGIGLEAMEAMASGMPVISTDGPPWNEVPALARIRASVTEKSFRGMADWYNPDPEHLIELCEQWLGKDISFESGACRQWAEANAWPSRVAELESIIYGDRPKSATRKDRAMERRGKFLFLEALDAFKRIEGSVIVELGAIRDTKPVAEQADGWSTVRWSDSGAEVHCVDNDQKAISAAERLVGGHVEYHCCDGLTFLAGFKKKIDLLYLDGPDADKGGQDFHVKALLSAHLADRCLVLIDDCDSWPERWRGRGKGEFVIPKALSMGFKILHDNDRQVLLMRDSHVQPESPQS